MTGSASLSYQWRSNTVNIFGATNASLTVNNVQLGQSGSLYSVVVTNTVGSATSSNAVLTVNPAPAPVPSGSALIQSAIWKYWSSSEHHRHKFQFHCREQHRLFWRDEQATMCHRCQRDKFNGDSAGGTRTITVTVNGLTYANQQFMPTFLGGGSGISATSFAPRVDLAAENQPGRAVIADVDGDGKPDLIVVNGNSGTVSIYRNINANGLMTTNSFAPPVDLASPSAVPAHAVLWLQTRMATASWIFLCQIMPYPWHRFAEILALPATSVQTSSRGWILRPVRSSKH